jgi:oxygen-independent coproporphyrinogen-3 oxidase
LLEHAIELDPRYVTSELAEALTRMRVTRASLGVQDLSPHVQQAIGRIQPFSQVVDAVAYLHQAGITRLNFDLMYGLPRQSVDDAVRSAQRAASLRPASFAVFGYAHVPWLKTHQRLIASGDLPGASERLEQFERIREVLTGDGYRAIGLDHFALVDDELAQSADCGRLHRNFQGYTTDEADVLIGLGASAIGSLPQGFVQNSHDIARYERRIAAGEFATTRGLQLSDDDRVRAAIIERLMCDFAVDLDAIASEFAMAPGGFSAELERLSHLPALVDVDGQCVAITRQGQPFARLIAAEFDTYLQNGAARHSRAV